jgi:hypothetical protein
MLSREVVINKVERDGMTQIVDFLAESVCELPPAYRSQVALVYNQWLVPRHTESHKRVKTNMDTATIIADIEAELERLSRVRNILSGHDGGFVAPRKAAKPQPRRRTMSAEARERIAAAQRKRWAKQKKAAKAAAASEPRKLAPKKAAKKGAPKTETPAAG